MYILLFFAIPESLFQSTRYKNTCLVITVEKIIGCRVGSGLDIKSFLKQDKLN